MEPPAPPSPPPLHINGGRGQGGAPRGWELLRNLQVRTPRRPYTGPIAEANMNSNPGRYRGGGMPLEYVRGGMGRGRRPNRAGRGGRMQNTNSLGAMPDCVPESTGFPHHNVPEDAQQQQEEHNGAVQREDVVNDLLLRVHVSDSGNPGGQSDINQVSLQPPASDMTGGRSAGEADLNHVLLQSPANDMTGGHSGSVGLANVNQVPNQPPANDLIGGHSLAQGNINQAPLQPPANEMTLGLSLVMAKINQMPLQPPAHNRIGGCQGASPVLSIPSLRTDTVAGQHAMNPMPPIPFLQNVPATDAAPVIEEKKFVVVGPLTQDIIAQQQPLPRNAIVPPGVTGMIPLSCLLSSDSIIIPYAEVLPNPEHRREPNMTEGIVPKVTQAFTPNVVQLKPDLSQVQSILERSTLSPNAKEFIPLSKRVQFSQQSVTNSSRSEIYRSACSGYSLSTQGESGSESNDRENCLNNDQMAAAGDSACGYQERLDDEMLENWNYTEMVETLQLVQFELVKHPANFNNLMRNITPALIQWLKTNLVVPMVELIINMATQQDNFGYMATRMCVYVSNLDPSNMFRTILIERCHVMCQNIAEEKKSTTFLGFVMFLAELYVQFKNERGQRVIVIGTGLLECLENLISEPVVYDNLKFFCNALKLAGYYLDTDLKSAMNQLMTHIQSVMAAVGLDNIDTRIYIQLQKLIDMRNNNWDNQGAVSFESHEEEDGTSNSNTATYYSDAVFYGPDGQVLTLEESQFLTENQSLTECMLQKENQNESYDEDSSKEDGSDSMDEEMQDAFEQFLQMVPDTH